MTMPPSQPKMRFLTTRILCVVLLLLSSISTTSGASSSFKRQAAYKAPKEDPYRVLGVTKATPIDDIKKAYHAKAKAHHPDKNRDADATKTADKFRRIQDAWEFLSDPGSKRMYDLLGQTSSGQKTRRTKTPPPKKGYTSTSQGKHKQQHFTFNNQNGNENNQKQQNTNSQKHRPPNKAQLVEETKLAQATLVKLSTLDELKSKNILDQEGRFRRHFLAVFVGGKRMEQYVDQELRFPYPFYTKQSPRDPKTTKDNSGSSKDDTMPWEDILITAKIRYNNDTPLTRTFRAPKHSSNTPYVVLGKKGDRMQEFKVYKFPRTTTLKPYEALQEWVIQQLTSVITVTNHHEHANIHIYLDKTTTEEQLRLIGQAIPPNHQATLRVHLSDQLWILNAHTDQFFTNSDNNSNNIPSFQRDLLQRPEIRKAVAMDHVWVTELEQYVKVGGSSTRKCYDRSLHCHDWAQQIIKTKSPNNSNQDVYLRQNCQVHFEFGHSMCPYSCGVCLETSVPGLNTVYYGLFHVPLQTVPTPILRGGLLAVRGAGEFAHMFFEDLYHLWTMRRNVMAAFVIVGLVLGLQLVVVGDALILPVPQSHHPSLRQDHNKPLPPAVQLSWDNVGLVLLLTGIMIALGVWLTISSPQQVPEVLRGFHHDLHYMMKQSTDALYLLLYSGFLSLVISKKFVERTFKGSTIPRQHKRHYRVFATLTLGVVSLGVLLGVTLLLENDILISGKENHRNNRWLAIWMLRKNVAVTVVCLGVLLGAMVLSLGRFLWHCQSLLFMSLMNSCILVVGGILAMKDRYFLRDLEHVLDMRMSAAVPCTVLGMIVGMSLIHFLTTYQVKVKVD